jgi:hypothetical protein
MDVGRMPDEPLRDARSRSNGPLTHLLCNAHGRPVTGCDSPNVPVNIIGVPAVTERIEEQAEAAGGMMLHRPSHRERQCRYRQRQETRAVRCRSIDATRSCKRLPTR